MTRQQKLFMQLHGGIYNGAMDMVDDDQMSLTTYMIALEETCEVITDQFAMGYDLGGNGLKLLCDYPDDFDAHDIMMLYVKDRTQIEKA